MMMRPSSVAILVMVILSSGCLSELGVPEDTQEPGPAGIGRVGPVNVSTTWPGAEPVLDTAPDGTIYVEGIGSTTVDGERSRNVNRIFRSLDNGETWTDVTPPGTGNESSNDGYLAVGPDGTVFASNVFGLTFQLFRSTDQGETWVPLDVPRIPALMHRHWIEPVRSGTVHVTIEALDPGAAPFLAGGPSLEGTLDSRNKGMYYARSTDNGTTWTTPVRIDPQINYVGQSNMAVSQDGSQLFVVRYEEEGTEQPLEYSYERGTFYLLASEDGGDSWERKALTELTAPIGSALTALTIDPAGTLYFAWAQQVGNRSVTHLAVSQDQGSSWQTRTLELSDGTQAMPFVTARGNGELELLWYDAHVDGMPGDVDASWHIHHARVTNADTANPTIQAERLTPFTVHEGSICVKGPACGPGEDRRLLDYVWADIGPQGRSHLVWSSTMWDEPSAFPAYAGLPAPS